MSSILSINNCDLSNVSLCLPENNNEVLYSEIFNKNEPLYLQTPRMTYDLGKKFIKLLFADRNNENKKLIPFFSLIKDIEHKICDLISESSESWFFQKIESEVISNDLFKSVVYLPESLLDTLGMKISIPMSLETGLPDFEVYNKSQKKLDISVLEKGQSDNLECTFLLLGKEVVISSTQAKIEWELVQVLTHKKKKKIHGFGIRDDTVQKQTLKKQFKLKPDDTPENVPHKPVVSDIPAINLVDESSKTPMEPGFNELAPMASSKPGVLAPMEEIIDKLKENQEKEKPLQINLLNN